MRFFGAPCKNRARRHHVPSQGIVDAGQRRLVARDANSSAGMLRLRVRFRRADYVSDSGTHVW
jgi:hypothetical protein